MTPKTIGLKKTIIPSVKGGRDWKGAENGHLGNKAIMLLYVALSNMKPLSNWNLEQELVRTLLLAFLGCKHLYEAFALPQVSDERLKSFREGNEEERAKHGPKLRNSRLDKRGITTTEILASEWNETVMHRLAQECTEIASRTKDTRFGKEKHDWLSMICK